MDTEYNLEDEILDDVEPYTGSPEYDKPQTDASGAQDYEDEAIAGLGFMAKVVNAIRTWFETISWLKSHQTASDIGFDPDNMCLKVCRTARNIPAKFLTALEAQIATPEEHRVYDIADLRRGMVLYFDDPVDANRAGHIVTLIGRVRGFNPGELGDLLVVTNSVQANRLTIVRGDYFADHWGDEFQFGATILNGVELDVPGRVSRIERFNNGGPVYDLNILAAAAKAGRPKAQTILLCIEDQIKRLPDSPKLFRVREFKSEWRATRKIDMSLLDAAVKEGRTGVVKSVRDGIRHFIAALPDE